MVRISSEGPASTGRRPGSAGERWASNCYSQLFSFAVQWKAFQSWTNYKDNCLEKNSIGAVKEQYYVYHQLTLLAMIPANVFEPYAWYTEAARLKIPKKPHLAAQQF